MTDSDFVQVFLTILQGFCDAQIPAMSYEPSDS